ncbi:MAG: T9SS type A sorting domain-containing protein [Chitinophagaceae bacterium]|nr:T9SS type A sorting domain-containing protein [Chitinophagaceae bacterium]
MDSKNMDDVSNLGIHTNNCGIAGISDVYFRSKQDGVWYDLNTWESSSNLAGPYNPAVKFPTSNNSDSIIISANDTVSITNCSVVANEIRVEGNLRLGRYADLDLVDGIGVELDIAGIFVDSSENVTNFGILDFLGSETWELKPNAHFFKLRNTSSTFYRDNYNGGIANIPASAVWHLRCISSTTFPSFLSANMTYPTLSFENISGTHWNMTSAVNTFSSSVGPTIKGDFNIKVYDAVHNPQSNDSITVVQNAASVGATSSPIIVMGNFNLGIMGAKFTNEKVSSPNLYGGGIDIKGNINLDFGAIIDIKNNPTDNAKSALTFSGGNLQYVHTVSIGALSTINLSALELNKTGSSLSVHASDVLINVFDSLYLTQGYLHTSFTPGIFEGNSALVMYDTTIVISPNSQYNTCCAVTNIGWEKSFVSGPIIRYIDKIEPGIKWLPIGKVTAADTTFAPINLEKQNAISAAYLGEYYPTHFSNLTVDIAQLIKVSEQEYWRVLQYSGSDFNAKLGLSWRPKSNVGDGDPAHDIEAIDSLCLAHYFNDGSGTKWRIDGYVNSSTPGFNKIGNINYGIIKTNIDLGLFAPFPSFPGNPFTLGGKSPYNILPLRFIDFTAVDIADKVALKWIVAQEQQINKYEIEKSIDGKNFTFSSSIASLKSINTITYSGKDSDVQSGWNYYRIKIIESNGTISYSKIIKIWIGKALDVKIYPTMVTDEIKVNLPTSGSQFQFNVLVINSAGQVVKQLLTNKQILNINIGSLSSGVYFIKVFTSTQTTLQKFIKL